MHDIEKSHASDICGGALVAGAGSLIHGVCSGEISSARPRTSRADRARNRGSRGRCGSAVTG